MAQWRLIILESQAVSLETSLWLMQEPRQLNGEEELSQEIGIFLPFHHLKRLPFRTWKSSSLTTRSNSFDNDSTSVCFRSLIEFSHCLHFGWNVRERPKISARRESGWKRKKARERKSLCFLCSFPLRTQLWPFPAQNHFLFSSSLLDMAAGGGGSSLFLLSPNTCLWLGLVEKARSFDGYPPALWSRLGLNEIVQHDSHQTYRKFEHIHKRYYVSWLVAAPA